MATVKSAVTPMMAQFLEIKADYPSALLFYRMGDFYELFFDDAVSAAAALDIALTKRGKHLGEDIPMCGVPFHAAEGYLLTLIRKGFRVAVCEQLETPAEAKKRGHKSVVKRGVVRLVTPGTLSEDTLLDARRNNFLAAFSKVRDEFALAWADMSTGEFRVTPCAQVRFAPELARLGASEVIVPEQLFDELAPLAEEVGTQPTPLSEFFSVASLEAFGGFTRAETSALGAVFDYLDLTQKGQLPLLRQPQREAPNDSMMIDAATRRNLEITHSLNGGRSGSLLSVIDRTITAAGARLLERQVSTPSQSLAKISGRHDAVEWAVDAVEIRLALRESLKAVPDIERALSRIALSRSGPRDLTAIRSALTQAEAIAQTLSQVALPDLLAEHLVDLETDSALLTLLDEALVAEPPLLARDGGFIAPGYDESLDELRQLRDEGRGVIGRMQGEYATQTGISSLKIKHNNVLGYFIETTQTHLEKMMSPPFSETFIHRQTTANVVRFTTVELSELETKILNAGAEVDAIEMRLYSALVAAILEDSDHLHALATALATVDVTTALADLASDLHWAKPKMTNGLEFDIKGGRHPVVEKALQGSGGSFVANDCDLGGVSEAGQIWLLTGPNMAGKSTFLRQNALIALLAQAGSFVPASEATLGVVSQLFSRVGASDDLARGRSTFMVEMVETAAILNQADNRAMVILDEIGRGTSTYDGLSIAWATLEHLHDANQCRSLFATHYHELTNLDERLDRVKTATVSVREWEGEVIFLHEVTLGKADRSYGVQVAKLAGLPEAVTDRARDVLERLESADREDTGGTKAVIDDLPLFSATPAPRAAAKPGPSPLNARLEDVHPDELTPREALNLVYELKKLSRD